MKKLLTFVVAVLMTIPMMAVGRNDGSTKANAIDFDWDKGLVHEAGTKWYRVDLAPLYEEENPSLALYLTNPSNAVGTSVNVSMQATVAGQAESSDYTIAARQYKTYTANASMLVRMKQTEIYLTLTTNGTIKLSAKVFEAADLDETCQDARTLSWGVAATQAPSYSAWWKVSLNPIKNASDKDAKITITNVGSQTLNLKVGQSLDCPSSGVTRRTYQLAPGEAVVDTVPRSMITNVQPDELYFGIENVEAPISIKVEPVDQPENPIIADTDPFTVLHVTDTIEPMPAGTTLYRIKVADMDSLAKYEPEFTYRNVGSTNAKVTVKMAFEVPAFGTSNAEYNLAPGEEEIVVYKKNMLEGMGDVQYIYLLTTVEGSDVNFYGRFKHVREGKACKTNIDFNWVSGHTQEARTIQWYAVDVAEARDNIQDIEVHVLNMANAPATLKGSFAFSCPYIDLQEMTHTIGASEEATHTLGYSAYAMMSDTVWIGLETNQDIKFWVTTKPATTKTPDEACLTAIKFDWDEGAVQSAGETLWYKIAMDEARTRSAKFPTVFVQNLSSTEAVTITAELSVECPDSIANEVDSLKIEANGSYSQQISRNLFENIVQDTIYLKVHTTQDIALQIRLTEEAEGASCASAIPFNWTSGNTQAANENLWYSVDLREAMKRGNDIELHIDNKENADCKGVVQLVYECPIVGTPTTEEFTFKPLENAKFDIQNSVFEMVEDSIVYINVQSTTSLRIWVDTLPVAPFDTIFAEGITLNELYWDSLYTLDVDTLWFIIPQSEIDKVRNAEEKVKPVSHLYNLESITAKIRGEAAFGFPITKNMMESTIELAANEHRTDTVPAGTFDQFLKKDSIIVRVTRPTGVGTFQFKAELVGAFNGNSRTDALPILLDKRYTQSPNTEMWYKINTASLKKDSLYNKILYVMGKNAGQGKTTVKVSVYDGLLSEVDLFEEYGLEKEREQTIPKGGHFSHNIPAQAVYGLGNVELYVKVRTTDSLVFETKFSGTYAPAPVDPEQANATLVVPNVDYVLPDDNQYHWYMICLPYIQNNYIYSDASTLTYELNGKATIEGTATFQDNMDCQMPVRKRTINTENKNYQVTKPLYELINEGIKEAGYTFDISSFQPQFIDSLLHRFVTNDSVTFYVRLKSDKEIKARINTPQITGDQCGNPMAFDWEHGNVNPAGASIWYHVQLDSLAIPDTCDLRLHVANWSEDSVTTTADIYFDCNDPKTKAGTYKIGGGEQDSIDIDRDFLVKLGWADMIIDYNSDKVTHIWAELIPNQPREYDYDTITAYVCQGGEFTDTITGNVYDPVDNYMTWNDTVAWQDGVTIRDSVTTFYLHIVSAPEVITVDSMKKLNATPLLVQGMQLYVKASNDSLDAYYKAVGASSDTIIDIDTVYWAKPVYKNNGDLDIKKEDPLDLTSFYPKTQDYDTLLLVIKGGCETVLRQDFIFPLEKYKYVNDKDTVCPSNMPVVNPDTIEWQVLVLDTLGRDRQIDTIITYYARIKPTLYTESELVAKPVVANEAAIDTTYTLRSLKQQFEDDATELTMKVTDAKWQVNNGTDWQDLPYTVSDIATLVTMRYIIETECGVKDTSENINFVLTPTCENDTVRMTTPVHGCSTYHWTKNNQDYTATNKYYYDATDEPVGISCHMVYELNLIIDQPGDGEETVVICDTELPYMWKGESRATAGDHTFDTLTVAGCDSTITLHLFVKQSTTGDEYITICDKELPYNWKGIDRPSAGTYTFDTLNVAKCDSTITLHLTVLNSTTGDEYATICSSELPYSWKGIDRPSAGTYTFDTLNVANCDSTITLHLTVNQAYTMPTEKVTSCNLYKWRDVTYTETGIYYDSLTTKAGCDSVYVLDLTIKGPSYIDSLDIKAYYGYRIVMINRNQINKLDGWSLDSLDVEHPEYVTWHEIDLSGNDKVVGDGYYYNLENGEPLPTGYQYYAVIDVPASASAECGVQGKTKTITVGATAAAPALVPSLAKPGETIQVINLDPEVETTIRLFTAEGLLQKTYRSYGQESFSIKAAGDMGFYLVELSADNMKSTLRYIVK